ncbi:MAG: N-acetylmuramic acid 6-phosphate etherase [Phycisphaeraceae bacterium]|nr:N-acetylmuramic acid 6-phosphate etherase [Phycisphaeraceae bacterium]MCW5762929.1 N-acetylmuramic acid 6-phosphate etherase [Phycisphaeraceae bacterium]
MTAAAPNRYCKGMHPTPPDRGKVATESPNPATGGLGDMDIADCVAALMAVDAEIIAAMAAARPALTALIERAAPGFAAGGRVITVGAGTSGRLAVLDAAELGPTFCLEPGRFIALIAGGDAALRTSSEGREDDPAEFAPALGALNLGPHDTVIGLSAGGTTPCVLGALTLARAAGAGTGLIACSPTAAANAADLVVIIPTGPEAIAGSTRLKAGTATKMALNLISTALMIADGRVHENLMVDVRPANAKLIDRAARIITRLTGAERDAALALLERAGGSVKVAVLMHERALERAEAEAALAAARGRLHAALTSTAAIAPAPRTGSL